MNKYPFQKISTAVALAAGVLSAPCATADFEMYLKIPDIVGTDIPKGEIDVLSWSWGISQNKASPNVRSPISGEPCIEGMILTKYVDKATGGIIMASAVGTQLGSAQLGVREVDSQNNTIRELTIDLFNVLISSYKTGSSDDEDFPTEEVTFNYSEAEWTYTENQDESKAKVQKGYSCNKI
jgi:type VI secretion system secreted protein Hcp